jgi:ABC-type sugar transport system substrate-binding protein
MKSHCNVRNLRSRRIVSGVLATLVVAALAAGQSAQVANAAQKPTEGTACAPLGAVYSAPGQKLLCGNLTGQRLWTRVLKTTPVASVGPLWVKWNPASCGFIPAKPPLSRKYVAYLRKAPNSVGLALGAQSEGNSTADPFTAGWKANASATGAQVIYANYDQLASGATKVPDAARAIVTRRPSAVTSWMTLATAMPPLMDIYRSACIPVVQISAPGAGALLFAADNAVAGRAQGDVQVANLKSRGLATGKVTALAIRIPAVGADINQRADMCASRIKQVLPSATQDQIDLESSSVAVAQTKMTDWLTAHPDAGTVVVCTIADGFGIAAVNALKLAGMTGKAFVSGVSGQSEAIALLRSKDPVFIGTVDFGWDGFGNVLVPLMQDAIEGKPVPSVIHPQLHVFTAATFR